MACAFRLELLPDAARDALFAALTREEAARACCVCRAWQRALCGTARHLWAVLDFGPPFFTQNVTRDVVRGACAKARDALTDVTFHSADLMELIPTLMMAHPHLARVTVRNRSLRLANLRGALSLTPPLELHTDVVLRDGDFFDAPELLLHPSLRCQRLCFMSTDRTPETVAAMAAAVRAQAAGVVRLDILSDVHGQTVYLADDVTAPLVDALVACKVLRYITLPKAWLSAAAFTRLAEEVAVQQAPLERVQILSTEDYIAYAPALIRFLLPQLRHLDVREDRIGTNMLRRVADGLRQPNVLHSLDLRTSGPAGASAHAALHAVLPTLQLQTLNVVTGVDDSDDLRSLAAHLPPTLESLTVCDHARDAVRQPALTALIAAVAAAPSLREFNLRPEEHELSAADVEAIAAALLRPGAAPRLRKLSVTAPYVVFVAGASALAHALRGNCTLQKLQLQPCVDDDFVFALAAALPHARALETLIITGQYSTQLSALSVNALAARLTAATCALRTLRFSLVRDHDVALQPDQQAELPQLAAAIAALNGQKGACRVHAQLQL